MTIENKGTKVRPVSPPSLTVQPDTRQAPSTSKAASQGKGTQNHNNLEERMNKKYSFKKEVVVKLFSEYDKDF